MQTPTAKQVKPEYIWDRKPFKNELLKLPTGNSYSEQSFLLYPYAQKRFLHRFPALSGKIQHLDHLCPGTKVFYLFLEVMDLSATNADFSICISLCCYLWRKIQTWKEWDRSLHFSSFLQGDFKKEKCLLFFLNYFFSAGNNVGKWMLAL